MISARPFFIPETIQTSGMDCGPAALKSLLSGLGVRASYERLRDACQTSASGTSIDDLQDICTDVGLDAYQEMAPLSEAVEIVAARAPCIVVVKGADGGPHFVVLWRVVGPWVQVMDPGRGRVWVPRRDLARNLHGHSQPFDEGSFIEWWKATAWYAATRKRLAKFGLPSLLDERPSATQIAAVDAGARLVERLRARGAISRAACRDLLVRLCVPDIAREVVPNSLKAISTDESGVAVRGAVFLIVHRATDSVRRQPGPLGKAVLGSDDPTPWNVIRQQLTVHGRRLVGILVVMIALIAVLSLCEIMLLRAAFNASNLLALPQQRVAGTAIYGTVVLCMLALEAAAATGVVRLGRALELRTRLALLLKLPRLPDKYFRTRPMPDITHRSLGLFQLKPLPETLVALVKQSLDFVVTLVALCVLYPRGVGWVLLALVFGLGVPYASLRARQHIEHRVQFHASALGQLYLDTLFGAVALRCHGGQLAVRAKQEEHLVDWHRDSERAVQLLSWTEALQTAGTLAAVLLLLLSHLRSSPGQGTLFLLAFWALRLPLFARALSTTMQRLPGIFAPLGRLVEPLTAEETPTHAPVGATERPAGSGIALEVHELRVVLSKQEVLAGVSFHIKPGEHVAIVGNSGAGKSSLLAVVLGVLEKTDGRVLADGELVEGSRLERLRRETVWVDPTVQIWNRSMLENILLGNPRGLRESTFATVKALDLNGLIERMPGGLSTSLGESGSRVSGGEGQRVRLARALLRRGARLMLLDEAFRGLDRSKRRSLSREIRERARNVTVLEVTHDVGDTRDYDRILVIEDGRLVEDGTPAELLADAASRYRELVDADLHCQYDIWNAPYWKRVTVDGGRVVTSESND